MSMCPRNARCLSTLEPELLDCKSRRASRLRSNDLMLTFQVQGSFFKWTGPVSSSAIPGFSTSEHRQVQRMGLTGFKGDPNAFTTSGLNLESAVRYPSTIAQQTHNLFCKQTTLHVPDPKPAMNQETPEQLTSTSAPSRRLLLASIPSTVEIQTCPAGAELGIFRISNLAYTCLNSLRRHMYVYIYICVCVCMYVCMYV